MLILITMFDDDLKRFESVLGDYMSFFGLRATSQFLNAITSFLLNGIEKIDKLSKIKSL